jgi:hypothetical protein
MMYDGAAARVLVHPRVSLHCYESHYLINQNADNHYELEHDPRVPDAAIKWFYDMGLDGVDPPSHVIVATAQELVGFFRFHLSGSRWKYLQAAGTWVLGPYRRCGLGEKMWRSALAHFPRVKEICIISGTNAGTSFALKMQRVLPVTVTVE